MKATLGDMPPAAERSGWSFELKWDGMRVVAGVNRHRSQLWSLNQIDVSVRFPELASLRAAAGATATFDGEIVAFDRRGRVDFATLQTRIHVTDDHEARRRAAATPVLYVVFDLLSFDGHDLTSLPLDQRVAALDEVLEDSDAWQRSRRYDDGEGLLEVVREQELEGIMAKRRDSPYLPGRRSPSWRKVKVRRRGELVVGGWLPGEGRREGQIGALLVGYHEPDRAGGGLRFAGRVGSGFTDSELDEVGRLLAGLSTQEDPFEPPLRRVDAPGARFVRPELVVEVAFGEWTPDRRMRHPSYLGRRFDKDASEVTRP